MESDLGNPLVELEHVTLEQPLEWRFERIGWVVIGVLLLLGLAGAFGDGALASASAASTDQKAVAQYARIVRLRAPATIALEIAAGTTGDSASVVSFDAGLLSGFDVQRVTPLPIQSRASDQRTDFIFVRADARHPLKVVFIMLPTSLGSRRGTVETSHGPIEFSQFVLP